MKKLIPFLYTAAALLLAACSNPWVSPSPIVNVDKIVRATLTGIAAEWTPTHTPEPHHEPPTETPSQFPPTAEPTQTPTASPTPDPIEEDPATVLGGPDFYDAFDNSNNWAKYNNECFANEIENGLFYMTAKGKNGVACWTSISSKIQDLYIQTQLQNPGTCQPDDNFGIIFRSPDNQRGYLFGLSCDGRMGLSNWDGENANAIVPWSTNPAINVGPNAVNRIGIVAYGGEFLLYANGKLVAQSVNPDHLGVGKIGYYVYASSEGAFTVKFDDLAYWLLSDRFYAPNTYLQPQQDKSCPPHAYNIAAGTTKKKGTLLQTSEKSRSNFPPITRNWSKLIQFIRSNFSRTYLI